MGCRHFPYAYKTGNNQTVDKRNGLVGALSEIALQFCLGYLGITYFLNLETSFDTALFDSPLQNLLTYEK